MNNDIKNITFFGINTIKKIHKNSLKFNNYSLYAVYYAVLCIKILDFDVKRCIIFNVS